MKRRPGNANPQTEAKGAGGTEGAGGEVRGCRGGENGKGRAR